MVYLGCSILKRDSDIVQQVKLGRWTMRDNHFLNRRFTTILARSDAILLQAVNCKPSQKAQDKNDQANEQQCDDDKQV